MKKANWENWVNIIMGIWVFLMPYTLSYTLPRAQFESVTWNFTLVGALITISATMALRDIRPWKEWSNIVLGTWLVLSPWIFGYTMSAALTWNSVVVGLIVGVLSAMALPVAQRHEATRRNRPV